MLRDKSVLFGIELDLRILCIGIRIIVKTHLGVACIDRHPEFVKIRPVLTCFGHVVHVRIKGNPHNTFASSDFIGPLLDDIFRTCRQQEDQQCWNQSYSSHLF